MEQTDNPTVAESNPQVDNFIPSNSKMEETISLQTACTTEKMVTSEISALVAASLDDILQRAYENARTGVF